MTTSGEVPVPRGGGAPASRGRDGPVDYERAFAAFAEVREAAPAAREAALARACGDDAALRREVESLLAHDLPDSEEAVDAAARAVAAAAAAAVASVAGDPARIGRYRVVRKVAEGGMGVVYEAVQDRPARTVALKLVRPDLAGPAVARRLEQEAETLAQLSHPGIAQVYEAGTHDAGRGPQPFLAMEFVRGVRLDEWVRANAPSTRERIALVAEVAEAVHHAHQRGVVHRDLKPGNVLVEADGRPRILDFGIARIAGAERGATLATQAGQVLGTLPYMSPEQLSGRSQDVDTRTDVYALGVLLYEVLVGRLPIDVTTESLASAARRVCEEEPPPLGRLDARLRGDVETIVAKALSKDREERYDSAQAFADDLRRHLADEPIEARPRSAVYVLAKFARRHRALAAVGAALAATLAAAAVGGAWLASRESEARRLADERAGEAAAERDAARDLAYRGAISSAAAAIAFPDVGRAEAALDGAPPERRGWEWRYLHARLDDALDVARPLEGHTYGGMRLVGDEMVVVDYARGRIEGEIAWRAVGDRFGPEHGRLVTGAVYPGLSPDGRTACYARYVPGGASLVPVDTRTGREGAVATPAADGGIEGALAEDGRHAWVATRLPTGFAVRVAAWPDASREAVADWRVAGGERLECAATPDLSTVLLWTVSPVVQVLRRRSDGSAEPPLAHALHSAPVTGCAIDPTGTWAASCSADSTLVTWDVVSGKPRLRRQGRPDEMRGVAISPDGSRLVTWGPDGSTRIRDAATGDPVATLLGHRGEVGQAFFSPDGARVYSRGEDGEVRAFDAMATDAGDFACVGHGSYVYEARFSPDGSTLATIAWDGTLRLWDARTGRETARLTSTEGAPGYTVAWHPRGRRLAYVSEHPGTRADARVLDLDAGSERVVSPSCETGRSVAWSSSGDFLAVLDPGEIRILDGDSYAERARIPAPDCEALALSSDGSLLAFGADTAIEVWDPRTPRRVARLLGHERGIRGLAFRRGGDTLASASWDGTVRVWDARAGVLERTLTWHRGRAHAVAWTPDGSRLLSGADDGRLAIWDAQTLRLVVAIPAHGWYVHGIDVSPDGSTVVTCSGDRRVRLWSTASRGDLHRLRRDAPVAPLVTLPAPYPPAR